MGQKHIGGKLRGNITSNLSSKFWGNVGEGHFIKTGIRESSLEGGFKPSAPNLGDYAQAVRSHAGKEGWGTGKRVRLNSSREVAPDWGAAQLIEQGTKIMRKRGPKKHFKEGALLLKCFGRGIQLGCVSKKGGGTLESRGLRPRTFGAGEKGIAQALAWCGLRRILSPGNNPVKVASAR